ncbi:MAG TPA: bifunctional 4-hydroxy-2-oxoglutarate aldolase/2-dehydro-3-deoxy-phosphogluconate aldolase [Spirochaetia bacterium]|nr:bifunctional 4-hydroxy-2-oxoglutarate aldolase/2-dehydro-3-deoxy-phosphogluconate aldolase [Spirochaetia bacterium]
MARFPRLKVLTTMLETGLVPVFYNPDLGVTKKIVKACADGGIRIFEFTNRGDHAVEVFTELEKYCAKELPDVILGVGSVIDQGTATMYIAYGANFVVGPLLNPEIARICNRRKIAYSPGCGSATEISMAEELGCEIVKVFPGGQVGGPAFVKAVLGPCPWVNMMPTGGVDVTEESLKAWFEAGVACVGIGSKLIRKDLVQAGDFEGITAQVKKTLEIIRKVRKK